MKINGCDISEGQLIIKGEGLPVLFLHGYLSCKESFYYQIESLSKYYKVIALDLPGFGKAKEPPFAYALDDYVDFAVDAINKLCGGNAFIVAHSFGGRIALKIASKYPDKIIASVLAGCAGIRPKRAIKRTFSIFAYKFLKKFNGKLAAEWEAKRASADYLALSPLMRESFKKIVNEHLDGILRDVIVPTLLVFGDKDTETPIYMAKKLNRGIRDSGLVVMKNCGHFCFSENPNYFNKVAECFFAQTAYGCNKEKNA